MRIERVHIRNAKGNKDRFEPLPVNTLKVLRRFWGVHKHPVYIFPNRKRALKNVLLVNTHLERGGVQTAMAKVVKAGHQQENILPLPAPQLCHPSAGSGCGPA